MIKESKGLKHVQVPPGERECDSLQRHHEKHETMETQPYQHCHGQVEHKQVSLVIIL